MKITYKNLFISFIASMAMVLVVRPALAADLTLDPWLYDPDSTGSVVAEDQGGDLQLEKNAPTPTNSAAGAEILGVSGMSTNDLTLQFDYDGYCNAGAPRFNVNLVGGATVFLGCLHGDADLDNTSTFVSGQTYGGVLFPTGEVVNSIDIVMDEEGQTTLSNVMVNDDVAVFEEAVLRDAEITAPVAGSTVSGVVNFEAYLVDDEADPVQWAVRQGTCAVPTSTVFGNVDGKTDVATLDQTNVEMQTFDFSADMSASTPGTYCFVYNPVEDSGETNLRETVEFTLEAPVVVVQPTNKDQCKNSGWMSFTNPSFKNQGDCVSFVQSSEKAKGNKKVN